jgi:hypothetical protein
MRGFIVQRIVELVAGVALGAVGLATLAKNTAVSCIMLFSGGLWIFVALYQLIAPFWGRLIFSVTNRIDLRTGCIPLGALSTPCTVWIFLEYSRDFVFGTVEVRADRNTDIEVDSLTLPKIQSRQYVPSFRLITLNSKAAERWPRRFGQNRAPLRINLRTAVDAQALCVYFRLESNLIGTAMEQRFPSLLEQNIQVFVRA